MNVFENLHQGMSYKINDPDYQREVHAEIDRCDELSHSINLTRPSNKKQIKLQEERLFQKSLNQTYITPPLYVDCGNQVDLGKHVYINHNLTMMSLGQIKIADNVMIGPGVGLFTVNHDLNNINIIMTKPIIIKESAWIGARVNILPGVTIGEHAVIGAGSVVTKNTPDNAVAVGNPAKVIKMIDKK